MTLLSSRTLQNVIQNRKCKLCQLNILSTPFQILELNSSMASKSLIYISNFKIEYNEIDHTTFEN